MPEPTPVDIRADGLLWLINRTVFGPRGYALTFDGSLFALVGDGSGRYASEVGSPSQAEDQFNAVEAILARTKREQSGLAGHIEATNPPVVDPVPEEPPVVEAVPAPGGVVGWDESDLPPTDVEPPPDEPVQGMEGIPAPGGVMLTAEVPDE